MVKRPNRGEVIAGERGSGIDQHDSEIAARQIREGLRGARGCQRAQPWRVHINNAIAQPRRQLRNQLRQARVSDLFGWA